jgi:diguanylate cyclase (GGDEF)-like protein/PAS domain S-box-containing protein
MQQSRLAMGFSLVSCAAIIGYFTASGNVQAFLSILVGAAAVLCVLYGVRRHRPTMAGVWYLLAFGLSLHMLGDVIFNLASISTSGVPFPSVSDAFSLSGNLAIVVACGLVILARRSNRDLGSCIDAAILASTATFLAWTFLMQPPAAGSPLTGAQQAVSLAYPATTALMFGVGVCLIFTGGRRFPSSFFIIAAIVTLLIGSVVHSESVLLGEYYRGHTIDLAFMLWYILWAAAALHPSMASVTSVRSGVNTPCIHTSNRRMILLVAAVLLVPITTIFRWAASVEVSGQVFVGFSTLLFLLVFWRMRNSVLLSERAVAERQHVLERERVLHDVASGLAVSSTQSEAFNAVTTSLRSIATDALCARIAIIDGDTGTIVSECTTSANPMQGRALCIGPMRPDAATGAERGRSHEIIHSLTEALELSRPGAYHLLHVVNPADETPIVLMLTARQSPHLEPGDLLQGVGVVLMQALKRISLAEENSRRRNQDVFHSLIRNSSDVTMIIEVDGVIRYVSPAAQTALGFSPDDLTGTPLRELIHPDDTIAVESFITHTSRAPGHAQTTEFRIKNAQDAWHDVELVANNLIDDPDVGGLVLNVHDISVRKRSEAMLKYQAFHDALTSLPNRALFLDRLSQVMKQANSHGNQVAVLFVDLDRFKFVNDSLGHDGGDALLIMASQRIRHCVANDDTVSRLGGDEFAVILNSLDTAPQPSAVADRLVKRLNEPFVIKDQELVITVSVGVALSTPDRESGEDLLREADIAMYQAKSQGRNGFVVFDAEMGLSMDKQVQLEQDLRRALDNKEFVLHFQPEVDLQSGRVIWFEALMRWQHPERGMLPPAEFIPLAEESGLILKLGRWAIQEACQITQEWRDRFPAYPFGVSVNLSAKQLLDPDLIGEITSVLQSTGLAPAALRMELTETTLMQELEVSLNTLKAVRKLGVQLAIDDFGQGYSSLGYLRYFPLDVLKLDRSFLSDSVHSEQDDAIIQTVAALAHGLGIKVTVEGIETSDQLRRVSALACDHGQGYLFARPQPQTEIPAMLQQDFLNQRLLWG